MRFLFAYLGLASAAQVPFQLSSTTKMPNQKKEFAFKEGDDVFTPKDLIQLGRPGAAVANPPGDLALVPFSKFSFEDKKNNKSVYVVSLDSSRSSTQISFEKGGETFWLSHRTFAHVIPSDDTSEIYTYDINLSVSQAYSDPVHIGSIPSPTAANFKYNPTTSTLVFSAYVYPDGDLSTVREQDKEWEERGDSAFVYDETYERHWDTWQGRKVPQLFGIKIEKGEEGKWEVAKEVTSPLKGINHYTPVEPFGGTDDFDVSDTHIAYTAKDPELPFAWHTKQNVYIVPISGESKPVELTSGKQGAIHNVVFNTKGSKVAWVELDKDGYEADRGKLVIYDLEKNVRFTVTQPWDRTVGEFAFSKDDTFIYLKAGEHAREKLFVLPVAPTPSSSSTHPSLDLKFSIPLALTSSGSASGVQTLPGSNGLIFTRSSLTSPNEVFVLSNLLDLEEALLNGDEVARMDALSMVDEDQKTEFGVEQGLSDKALSEGEDVWFKGAEGKDVHGWVVKPKGWKEGEKKRWPGLLLIHGGPQGAWEDGWSTRWNPNVFAQQGYFVVLINPTGSTSFGQAFTDAIAEDWGGKPFVDMIQGWKHVLEKFPEIDADRAVAAGASWGGYAINWIQGHPEYGFNFKALVCHDGVFDSTYNGYSTDELYFFNHEWGGRPWDPQTKKLSEKMSPSNFVHKWSTPQLIIHGSKDYRLPETEGIAVFHALQQLSIPSRLVIFPDENHWVLNHGNSLKWHYEVLRWFDQFVGDKDAN